MSHDLVIERRFRGPAESANGGYACGVVAALVEPGPAVEVTLRAPPPLEKRLSAREANGAVELFDGEILIAEGRPAAAPDLVPPAPVTLDQAEEARSGSPLHKKHSFGTCFVCGPEVTDGLQVVCGPVAGRERELVAAPFRTDAGMAGDDGMVRPELVWSVLDCPSGLAGLLVPGLGTCMLGRLTGTIGAPLKAGLDYIAVGWPIDREGRKFQAATAILDEDGETLALAEAIWIELAEQPSS